MEPTRKVASPAQFYTWGAPGKSISIRLSLTVVDRLLPDIMRGFGALPRRGAEVGGILLGTVEPGATPTVRIEDFEAIQSEYRNGPSYIPSEKDLVALDDALARWRQSEDREIYVVGYYRSHTRDGELSLGAEDQALCSSRFANPLDVVLLVRPYATRPCTAGFFFHEDESIPNGPSLLEFPFRRRELTSSSTGAAAAAAPPAPKEAAPEPVPAPQAVSAVEPVSAPEPIPASKPIHAPQPIFALEPEAPAEVNLAAAEPSEAPPLSVKKQRREWVWIPLMFVFLLLGVLLGFEAAITVGQPNPAASARDYFPLTLSISSVADSLHVRWNRNAPAVQAARRGSLLIVDGDYEKTVPLNASDLRNGSVIYPHQAKKVRFRLEIFPSDGHSIAETLEWTE